MDIKFYDFDFNLLAILPCSSGVGTGYTFLNYKIEFLGHGSFEITYLSEKIDSIAEEYRDRLFVVLDDFQGYLTGYRFQGDKHKLYGKHLNGLLNRRLIGPWTTSNKTVETIARDVISAKYDFLSLGAEKGFENKISHESTDYIAGDEFLKTLLQKDNAGYCVTADFVQRQLIFNVLKNRKTTLMLSESNLNAYDFDITYDNKEVATHGFYFKDDNITETIGDDSMGIYKIEALLSAETSSEAKAELKTKKPLFDITASTRRIRWNYDYQLGDIVRLQKNGVTVQKLISAVNVSVENSRIETPTLTDYEEVSNNG